MAWHRLTSLTLRISLLEKFLLTQTKGRLSIMNLWSPGPAAGEPISVKVKCRISFSEPIQRSLRGNLVHFKTKWWPKNSIFMYPFACIHCSDASTKKNPKQIEMNLKCSVKKNVIYWLNHTDCQIQEIFPSRLANPINKLVLRTHLFIGFATLSRNISCIWKSMWINLYEFCCLVCCASNELVY